MAKKKSKGAKKVRKVKRASRLVSKPQSKEVFFVGITDPIELRRSLLEASKDIVQDLQHFEQYIGARKQRKKLVEELKTDMHEITKLVSSLKKSLPSAGLRTQKVPEHESEKPKPRKHKKVNPAPKKVDKHESHELKKLESELGEIESKLGGLT